MADAPRDENFVPTALFESSTVPGAVAPGQIITATGRIKVDSSGGSSGTVTEIDSGTGIKLTPDPITTTGEVALIDSLAPLATLGTALQLIRVNAGATALEYFTASGGGVTSVVGTANRITVDSTDPAAPIVNIAATYVGQSSITTLGTIGTGVWQGTVIVGQYGGTGVANTGKTITVSGNTTIGSNTDTVAFVTTGNTSVTLPTSGTLATTTQIANMVTAAATFATDESILRADGTSRGAQATSTNATLTDAGAMVLASTSTAASFIPSSSSAPTNGMYLLAANTLGWSVNSGAELQLTATALSPAADDGLALGTTALGWQSLFGDTGFVVNIENGNWVATHTSAVLTVGTGDLRVTTAGTDSTSVVTVGGTQTLTAKTLTSPIINTPTINAPTTTFTVEPGADDTAYGDEIIGFNAGATIAQWDCVYLSSSSTWLLTDADAAATAGGVMVAMAITSGTNANPLTVLKRGIVRNDGWTWATVGAPLYLDTTTSGGLTLTQPSGTDDVIRIVGYVMSDDCIWFDASNDWITHT